MNNKYQRDRPTLNAEGPAAQEAIDAVAGFVEQLQAGWDHHDADISNQSFAADVHPKSGKSRHTKDRLPENAAA